MFHGCFAFTSRFPFDVALGVAGVCGPRAPGLAGSVPWWSESSLNPTQPFSSFVACRLTTPRSLTLLISEMGRY